MTRTAWDDVPRLVMVRRSGLLGVLAAARYVGSGRIPAPVAKRLWQDRSAQAEFGPYLESISRKFIKQMHDEFGAAAVQSMKPELLISLFELGWQRTATALARAVQETVDPTTRTRKRK